MKNDMLNMGKVLTQWNVIGLLYMLTSLLVMNRPVFANSVPAAINYQGTIADNTAVPLTGGYYHIEFRIWDDPVESGAGNLMWGRMFPLHVMDGGIFNVLLTDDGGEVTNPSPLTNDLRNAFSDEDRYLGLTIVQTPIGPVSNPVELQPRQQLVSSPYSFHAQHATQSEDSDRLGTIPASDYMLHSSFPGLQDPAKLITWDGAKATTLDAHLNLDSLEIGYAVAASGYTATNGAIVPSFGAGVSGGIQFEKSLAGNSAFIQFCYVNTNDVLQLGTDSSKLWFYDDGKITVYGESMEIQVPAIVLQSTETELRGEVSFDQDVTAKQDMVVAGDLTVLSGVKALSGWQSKGSVVSGGTISGTAAVDGFLMIVLECREVYITIGGLGWYNSSDAQNHRNWGASSYPVAAGETWSVMYIQNNDCGEGREPLAGIYWRSMGQAQ